MVDVSSASGQIIYTAWESVFIPTGAYNSTVCFLSNNPTKSHIFLKTQNHIILHSLPINKKTGVNRYLTIWVLLNVLENIYVLKYIIFNKKRNKLTVWFSLRSTSDPRIPSARGGHPFGTKPASWDSNFKSAKYENYNTPYGPYRFIIYLGHQEVAHIRSCG